MTDIRRLGPCITNAPGLLFLFPGLVWYSYISYRVRNSVLVMQLTDRDRSKYIARSPVSKRLHFHASILYISISTSYNSSPLQVYVLPGPAAKTPSNLVGHIYFDSQIFSKSPNQSRILLEHPADDGEIDTLLNQLLRLIAAGDGPDSANSHLVAYFLFDGFGERRLIAWTRLDFLFWVDATTAYV